MDDLISRQAAIDALDEQIEQCNKVLGSFDISPKDEYAIKVERASLEAYKEQLENMPSAQPQTSMLTVECKLDDEELAKAIEEVKKANLELIAAEPHWIPCSEQLPPEENKTYWVCTDNGHQHECRWTNANPIWTHLTTDWHWNIFDIPQYTKVVAWMELPKPYDGGEQDG